MSEPTKKQESDLISRLAFVFGMLVAFTGGLVVKGALRWSTWEWTKIRVGLIYFFIVTTVVYAKSHDIPFMIDHMTSFIPLGLGDWVYFHIARSVQLVILTVIPFLMWLALLGAILEVKIYRFQKALDGLGLTNPSGGKLKALDLTSPGLGLWKLAVRAIGFDIADVKSKKVMLESSLNLFVQEIRLANYSRQIVEVIISNRELPTLIPYDSVSELLTEPFSFLIGDAMTGKFIVTSLEKVRHLLVAGASGFGKSFFVKQLLIGLLQSSRHIQLYLLDLKKGVEVKVFEKLENVYIAKDEISAIETLDAVVKEMDRRFEYLEDKGYTEIDCERDKLDRIVVLVDEASELFTIVKSNKALKASAESARDLADRIAKLGRVAGIHLILATQKVLKQTIDTRVQANINARMVFRVNNSQDSVTVLGNKHASEIPEITGRGIWSVGSQEIMVQAPKLDNEEVAKKVAELIKKFNGDASPVLGKMLIAKRLKANQKSGPAKQEFEDGVNANQRAL
jgi:NTP pyrophosphatase (non-canonical NTP hydrolase)